MAFISSLFNKIGFTEEKRSAAPLTEAGIRQWLVERLAKQINVPAAQIETARTFESYGLDSLVALQVAGDLEKLLEQRLSPALLFEHQNIDDLAHYLATELASSEVKA
jgi:acyl carrier protein